MHIVFNLKGNYVYFWKWLCDGNTPIVLCGTASSWTHILLPVFPNHIKSFYVELGYFYTVAIAILMKEKNIEKYDWASFILILNSNCFADLATLIIITDYWLLQIPYQILPMYLWFAKQFQLLRFVWCFYANPFRGPQRKPTLRQYTELTTFCHNFNILSFCNI